MLRLTVCSSAVGESSAEEVEEESKAKMEAQEQQEAEAAAPRSRTMRRGDMVWARVSFLPPKWWPGLVLRADALGILVSFFNSGEKPRYFVEPQVCLFESNFKFLAKTMAKCSKGQDLLGYALELLGKRAVSGLRCRCLFVPGNVRRARNARFRIEESEFRADEVLGFVLGLAVSPVVDDWSFVFAVKASAQVYAFRWYLVAQQKKEKKNYMSSDARSKLLSCSLSLEGMEQEAQRLKTLELRIGTLDEDQPETAPPAHAENKDLPNWHHLDPYHMRGECLFTLKQNSYMIRNLSDHRVSPLQYANCEVDFSTPECSKRQPNIGVVGKNNRMFSSSLIPYVRSGSKLLGLKRRHDQVADSGFSFKLHKRMPLFSVNKTDSYLLRSRTGFEVYVSDGLISGPAFSNLSFNLCGILPIFSCGGDDASLRRNIFGGQIEVEIHNCKSQSPCRLTFTCNSDLMQFFQKKSNVGIRKDSSYASNTMEFSMFRKNGNVAPLCNNALCIFLVKEYGKGTSRKVLTNNEALFSTHDDAVKKVANVIKSEKKRNGCSVILLQPSTTEPGLDCSMRAHYDCKKIVNASGVISNSPLCHTTTDHIQKVTKKSSDGSFFASNGELTLDEDFEGNSDNEKNCLQVITPFLPLKRQEVNSNCLQSRVVADAMPMGSDDTTHIHTTSGDSSGEHHQLDMPKEAKNSVRDGSGDCHSLHIKFPKDFNVPSKNDLIRKFSVFGTIDSLRTKIFSYLGSAKVVFLHHLDAIAAYQFAKRRKSLFGERKVQYWLDRSKHKRRVSGPSYPPLPQGVSPKSCLKKSNLRGKEGKGCNRKVKFLMETSCLGKCTE